MDADNYGRHHIEQDRSFGSWEGNSYRFASHVAGISGQKCICHFVGGPLPGDSGRHRLDDWDNNPFGYMNMVYFLEDRGRFVRVVPRQDQYMIQEDL